MSTFRKRWLVAAACLCAAACTPSASTKPVDAPKNATKEPVPAPAPAWPQYQTVPYEEWKANAALRMVLADGTTTELVQMDHLEKEDTRAPGFEPSPLKTAVDEFDTGLAYVDLLASGFDLDGNGLADALVGISGGGNMCEFNGDYYIAFALPKRRFVSSEPFGGCSSFESAAMTKAGLEVHFLDGKRHLAIPGLPPPYKSPPPKCVNGEFFANYVNGELVDLSTENLLFLDLPVDLHGADCGAPDCHGHKMTLMLDLAPDGTACVLTRAEAKAESFECTGPGGNAPRVWRNDFALGKPIDLASPTLERIELRDPKRREAIVLLRDGYFFFENVDANSKLIPALQGDEDTGCCYGYTSSAVRDWRRTGPSPEAGSQ